MKILNSEKRLQAMENFYPRIQSSSRDSCILQVLKKDVEACGTSFSRSFLFLLKNAVVLNFIANVKNKNK